MAKIVEYWPKGYADAEGSVRITIDDDADANAEVRKIAGPYAEVFSIRPADPGPIELFSSDYIRIMSFEDNS